jgi:transcriptional regulator with XRE-family HTH domain
MEKTTHTKEYAALRLELQKARKGAGLTQRALAAKLGVAHSWVAKVEQGERRVDLIEFGRILRACGVDPESVASSLFRSIDQRSHAGKRGRSK